MNRRELIKMIAVVTGGSVIGADLLLSGCSSKNASSLVFAEGDVAFLDEIADTILPATSTPGARQAGVGKFLTTMVNDCYDEETQKIFHEGMNTIDNACDNQFGVAFMDATPPQRLELLTKIDAEAKAYQEGKKDGDPTHYFTLMKQLTLFGYFTSEVGMTKALNYVPIPGRYDACIDYKKGDKLMVGLDG